MQRAVLLGLLAGGLFAMPFISSAGIVISEVYFDPTGPDAGSETIEIKNDGNGATDISEYQLYPDGIGYVIFSHGITIESGGRLTIHLNAKGATTSTDVFASSLNGNMGNSSGAVALFRAGERGSKTIVDYVRYMKTGAGAKKTWESAAVDAGLWTKGDIVESSDMKEGDRISRKSGDEKGSRAWEIKAGVVSVSPSKVLENTKPETASPKNSTPTAAKKPEIAAKEIEEMKAEPAPEAIEQAALQKAPAKTSIKGESAWWLGGAALLAGLTGIAAYCMKRKADSEGMSI